MKKREADKMTLEQYMRELWLMDKQYGQEEELYPLINMLLRDGANTENLSIRDVHKGESAKNDKSRKYIDGFGSFPDIAIFDESFPDLSDENIVSNLQKIYGCVEAKCNEKNPKQIEVKIVAENKSEQPKQENYFIKRNNTKTYLHDAKGRATVEGQLLGELLWYGKVLYTDGLIWKYYKLSEDSRKINNKRKRYIELIDKNELPQEPFEYKTWIFEQCKETLLKIISADIGDLTEIYEKIKDKTSIPTFDSQDYDKWKKFKTNLATIDWTEVIF